MKFDNSAFLAGLAERMRELMEGETQISLAAKLNVSQGNVAKYLQGKIIPRADVLLHMIMSKNVNPTWFLIGKGPKHLGKGYEIQKGKLPKASARTSIPYGTLKELKSIESRLEKVAINSPESLREVKLFVSAVEQSANARKNK